MGYLDIKIILSQFYFSFLRRTYLDIIIQAVLVSLTQPRYNTNPFSSTEP